MPLPHSPSRAATVRPPSQTSAIGVLWPAAVFGVVVLAGLIGPSLLPSPDTAGADSGRAAAASATVAATDPGVDAAGWVARCVRVYDPHYGWVWRCRPGLVAAAGGASGVGGAAMDLYLRYQHVEPAAAGAQKGSSFPPFFFIPDVPAP